MYYKVMNLFTFKSILSLALLVSIAIAETPSHQLLTYPFSNRSASMGGSRAVDASGNLDIQGNPASASFIQGLQGQVGFVNHLVGIQGFAAAGVLPLERHRIAAELIYFDYGLFDRTDIVGTNQGTFGYHELAATLGYAFKFSEGIRLGGRVGVARIQVWQDSDEGNASAEARPATNDARRLIAEATGVYSVYRPQ